MKTSPHEGLVVQSYQHEFRIINGRRVWLSKPPAEVLSCILADAAALAEAGRR